MTADQDDLEELVGNLPKAARQRLLEFLGLPSRSTAAASTLQKACRQAADWKLALKMLRQIAVGVGHRAGIF